MIDKMLWEFLIIIIFLASMIVLSFSRNIFEKRKFQIKLKKEIELLKKEIIR